MERGGEIGGGSERRSNDKERRSNDKKRRIGDFESEIIHDMNALNGKGSEEFEAQNTDLEPCDENGRQAESCRVHGGKKIGPRPQTKSEKRIAKVKNIVQREAAEEALKFYEESQGAAYEVVEPLSCEFAQLQVRGDETHYVQGWRHMSFTAKPKNADCNDVHLKYFAEFLQAMDSVQVIPVHCSTFEPSFDPGFKHGCIICPSEEKFHPGPDGYSVGRPPYYKAEREYYVRP